MNEGDEGNERGENVMRRELLRENVAASDVGGFFCLQGGEGGSKKKEKMKMTKVSPGLREYGHIVDQQWCSVKFLDS